MTGKMWIGKYFGDIVDFVDFLFNKMMLFATLYKTCKMELLRNTLLGHIGTKNT